MRTYPLVTLLALFVISVAFAQPVIKTPLPAVPVEPAPPDDGKLPEGVRLRLGSSKFREAGYLNGANVSPDCKLIAVGNGSQVVRFIDIATGKEVRRIGLREPPRSHQLFWSPDGKQLVSPSYNGINIWDAMDGMLIRQIPNPNRNGQDGLIHISDNGKSIAIGNQFQNGSVRVIDLTDGSQLASVKPMQTGAVQGALSPKGETLATWGQHYNRGIGKPEDEQQIARTIQLWDAKDAKEKGSLVSDIYQIACVQFSPDGAKLAAGGNGVVQLWDVATSKVERRFAGRTGQGTQIVFSPDGKTLTAAGTDGCVQSWEVATGKRAGLCEGPTVAVAGLRYRPDGQLLAWGTNVNAIEIWEVPSGKRLTPEGGHTAAISAIRFAADGKTLISCGNEGKMLRWELATGKELGPFEFREAETKRRMYGTPRQVGPSHFSPNGKYLVAAGSNGGVASVWDVDAGLELFALTNVGGYVNSSGVIAFSGDSSKLIAMNRYGGRDASVPIPVWDMETGQPLPPLKGQKGDIMSAAFSTDGSILVTGSFSYNPQGGGQMAEAWAWDLSTGKVLSKVQVPNTQIQAIQFLDHRLFTLFTYLSPQNGIKVYDAVTGREVRTLENPKVPGSQPTVAMALSLDRRLFAYGLMSQTFAPGSNQPRTNRSVVIWEVASGSIRYDLSGIEGNITALAFSQDGKTLAAGCSDTTIYLWDLHRKAERSEPLATNDLDALWKTLESPDAKKAEEALRTLTARPAEAVPFLKKEVKPSAGVNLDPAAIQKLITDLDAPRYAVREAAMRDLEKLGKLARVAVQEALKKTTITPEVRERLEKLSDVVNKPDSGTEWIRPLRAVEALERIATPDAVAYLKELASGGDAPPTRMAKEAVGRLAVR
jgi:WD40 repeat protein